MKYLLEFAKFRDVLVTDDKKLLKKINKKFKDDSRIIFDVFLKNYNKHLILRWNDIKSHSMLERIKERTAFKSVSEFNSFIDKTFNDLFNNHFYEIDETARYGIHPIENNFYILIDIDYKNMFSEYAHFFIPTITLTTPDVYKIIEINDEYF